MKSNNIAMTFGFFFSLVGDIILIQKNNKIFLKLGIVAFALAHIGYICGFIADMIVNAKFFQSSKSERTKFLIQQGRNFILLNSLGFYLYLKNFLPEDLFIPVSIYVVIITLAVLMSFYRQNYVNTASFAFVTIGSILFLYSDMVLALFLFVDKFKKEETLMRLSNMILYFVGQWMIYKGSQLNNAEKIEKKIN